MATPSIHYRFQLKMMSLGLGFLIMISTSSHLGSMQNVITTKMMDNTTRDGEELQALCGDALQRQLDYIASFLKVKFLVEDEKSVGLLLINSGSEDLLNCIWEIYFSMIILPLKPNYTSEVFNMSHVNGFLFRLTSKLPPDISVVLPRGGKHVITIEGHMPTKYFAFPNWFVIEPINSSLKILSGTFLTNHSKMVAIEETYTSEERFEYNKNLSDGCQATPHPSPKLVIPTVFREEFKSPVPEFVTISKSWSIGYSSGDLISQAILLEDFLGLEKVETFQPAIKMVFLLLESLNCSDCGNLTEEILESTEAYKLLIKPDSVLIQAPTRAGVFYAVQTLMALCRNNESTDSVKKVPLLKIVDFPRYKYRGLMIDVARHFQTVDTLKKLITTISSYKMNRLHIHLSDDEGWRIEVPGLPELTALGSRPTAKYGSSPKFDFLNAYVGQIPTGLNSTENPMRQFYTQDEYRSILRHASIHHVTVIPELDFPGHSHAALVSMRARKRRLRLEGDPNAEANDLEDEDDVSDDSSVNNVADTVVNVCKNSTIDFIRTVVERLLQLHEKDQPLESVHLGGDEVSHTALSKSPVCGELLGPDIKNVSLYALGQLLALGHSLGKDVIFWETNERDLHLGETRKPIVHFWQPSLDRDKVLADYIGAGLKVILSEADTLYLDHPSEPSTLENGLRWATSKITTFDVFKYIPPRICNDDDDDKECEKKMEHVIGMQANLWSELIWSADMADEMLFPRLLAVAERAWHKPGWEEGGGGRRRRGGRRADEDSLACDWSAFAATLVQRELSVLDGLKVNYWIPPPGARRTSDGTLVYNTLLPGLKVVMSRDSGRTWEEPDGGVTGDVLLATLSADGKRKSRFIPVKGQTGSPAGSRTSAIQTNPGSVSSASTLPESTVAGPLVKEPISRCSLSAHVSGAAFLFCVVCLYVWLID